MIILHERQSNFGLNTSLWCQALDFNNALQRRLIETDSYEDEIVKEIIDPADIDVTLEDVGGLDQSKEDLVSVYLADLTLSLAYVCSTTGDMHCRHMMHVPFFPLSHLHVLNDIISLSFITYDNLHIADHKVSGRYNSAMQSS